MKKQFKENKKGEVVTVLTLATLVFMGVASLVSSLFLKQKTTKKTKAAVSCSQVSSVSYSPSQISAGQTFTCALTTDGTSPYTMACGLSKNGGWPQNMISGSCSGSTCSFQVRMDSEIDSNATYELVGFDYRSECGPTTGKRVSLNVVGVAPRPTQADCDPECCGKPDGYIYNNGLKLRCDTGYKGGRYIIIEGICQNGKKSERPGCATCKSCKAGDPEQSVSASDLAVNECTGGCGENEGICANLSGCASNVTSVIIRSCSDTSFSCPAGYSSCKKDGAIWCYGGGGNGGSGGPTPTPTRTPTPPPGATNTPTPTPTPTPINAGNLCEQKQGECILRNLDCNITLGNNYKETNDFELNDSCGSGKKCCLPRQTDRQTPTPTKTPIPTLTPTPMPTPTLTLKPTQPLISDTGIWSVPGRLYIENINNDKTIRIIVVSLVGNYDQINEEILPRQHIVYYYSKLCNLVRRRLSGYIAYYSSEDNYNMAHFKEINVSCNSYLVVGLK